MRILEISLQILFITIEECLKTFIKKDFLFLYIYVVGFVEPKMLLRENVL